PVPPPQSICFHKSNPDYDDGIWAVVAVDLAKLSGKSRRINITLPERVVNLMDRYATAHGATRSGLIAEAALAYIAHRED
ncbi:MAG: type II toxin-antitoxin system HicB family antitoxin, partial [Candidatus Latescibacteria bacterium]|nr:type II toxin-antitoxin system HicB family antitoxin [Candidatus Latescibacterota bacterium]